MQATIEIEEESVPVSTIMVNRTKELILGLPEEVLNSMNGLPFEIEFNEYGTISMIWFIGEGKFAKNIAHIDISENEFSGYIAHGHTIDEVGHFEQFDGIASIDDLPKRVFEVWIDSMKEVPYIY